MSFDVEPRHNRLVLRDVQDGFDGLIMLKLSNKGIPFESITLKSKLRELFSVPIESIQLAPFVTMANKWVCRVPANQFFLRIFPTSK